MAGTSLRQFVLEMDAGVRKLTHEQFVLAVRKLALDLLEGIVLLSPVGNPDLWKGSAPPGYVGGRFRGNWQVTLGQPAETETPDIDQSGGSTIARGAAVIATSQPFGTIWISNNVPYAAALEDGHSTQAPVGVVEINVRRVNATFARLR